MVFDEFGTQKDLFPIQSHLDAMGIQKMSLRYLFAEGSYYFDWTNLSWAEVVQEDEPYEVCQRFIDNCEDREELQKLKDAIELRLKETL
ncbi:TPA: hypothetical protein NJ361_005551 [Vibrio parahaemolyticus]|nr:hypothetical protein [Vibrio parahaemolyticus]HCG7250481.1 hypothetical protein [Vibrio parahaemolyticus]HCG7253014.1 hypothetical protein [Vibrio parahaemolyticus]HCG7323939.1 hypothetical protein [Vibrio parahaemolyticus]HCG7326456.1 hypothetical protein [Vibrio parahaemolyticus]